MRMDDEAITTLFGAHHDDVMRYAIRRVGRVAAPDVAAETFVVAFRHAVMPVQPLPWLYAIARNVIRNHRRSQTRVLRGVSPTAEPDIATGVAERDALLAGLRSLPEQAREALMLVAWEGLTPEAAALVMGCSHAAFRMRLSRARRQLDAAVSTRPVPWIKGVTS
jgi:RNA polymerase sigma-70 factor (ECF subfamily)